MAGRAMAWGLAAALAWVGPIWAADEALITAINGSATRLAEGAVPAVALAPFARLSVGDRVELSAGSSLTLVIAEAARQEQWQGPGVIELTPQAGQSQQGTALITAKPLPAQIARQIGRTPSADTVGQFGVVRVRAMTPAQQLLDLEQAYGAFRQQTPAEDRSPELFWLSGLFQLRAMERLQQEVTRLRGATPQPDAGFAAALDHYAKAF